MRRLLAFSALTISAAGLVAQSVDVDRYLWETCVSSNVAAPQEDVDALRTEVDRILNAGHLAPLRMQQADQKVEGYALYQEPGRIVATLAMAYPYLTATQQAQVRTYIRAECANPAWAPWSVQMHLPPQQGSRREWYTMVGMGPTHMWDQDSGIWVTTGVWQWDWWWALDGQRRPRIATLYGLWLYAFVSGDWDVVRDNWDAIKNCYYGYREQAETYGTMSAHIAMARMARFMGDTDMLANSTSSFAASLAAGLNFAAVENKTTAYYEFMYGPTNRRGGVYKGFMFLNLAPEIGRFLKDHVSGPVLSRHASGKNAFPYWWIMRAPAGVSWTGHEGRGQIPEIIGMIAPVERWVVGADAHTMASYRLRYSCHGIGDCYAIEGIIYTISAYGTDTWVDVRSVSPPAQPEPTPPMSDTWGTLVRDGEAVFAGGGRGYVRLNEAGRLTVRFRPTGTGDVAVRVYTVRGAKVWERVIPGVAGQLGTCEWTCTDANNALVASGVYVVTVKGPGLEVKRRIAVVK
jgi:hypothetical protein